MEHERKDIKYQIQHGYKLYTLIHYVNKETLLKQHMKQRTGKATGVDKITKEKYEKELYSNIDNLLEIMKKFLYKPQPVKRVLIPKQNGKLRLLGISIYEEKLVQGAMAEILNEIYECKFLDCSYGFRPNRNCHQAIREINQRIMINKVAYYGINGMLEELYKLYYHTKYIIINAMEKRNQRKKTLKHMLGIFKAVPIAKPKLYKDIWCWNV